jgi:hypothetical protein
MERCVSWLRDVHCLLLQRLSISRVEHQNYWFLASRILQSLQAFDMGIVLTAPPFASAPPVGCLPLDRQRCSMPVAIWAGVAYVAHIDIQTSAVIVAQERRKRR